MKLRNLTELVKTIMEQQPETRSSDNLLYIEVLKRITSQNVLNMPVWLFYQNLTEWQLPSIETVGRCRRKAQDRKSTRLNSSHRSLSRMPSSA